MSETGGGIFSPIASNDLLKRSRGAVAFAVLVVFACTLAIPFIMYLFVDIIAAVLCALFLLIFSEKKIPTLLILVFLGGMFGLSSGMPMIALCLIFTVGTGAFAWLINYTASPYLAIIPVLSYAISTVITRSWFGSLLTLSLLIPALLLAYALAAETSRVGALCVTSTAFIGFLLIAAFLSMLYFTGECNLDYFRNFFDSLRQSLAKVFASLDVSLANGSSEPFFSSDQAETISAQIIALTPAILVFLSNTASFFAQKIHFLMIRRSGGKSYITEKMERFFVSPFSGVTFLLSFIIMSIIGNSYSTAAAFTVCTNLYWILLPGLVIMCFAWLSGRLSDDNRRGTGTWFFLLLVILAFFNVSLAVTLAACLGAYASVMFPLRNYLQDKWGGN